VTVNSKKRGGKKRHFRGKNATHTQKAPEWRFPPEVEKGERERGGGLKEGGKSFFVQRKGQKSCG